MCLGTLPSGVNQRPATVRHKSQLTYAPPPESRTARAREISCPTCKPSPETGIKANDFISRHHRSRLKISTSSLVPSLFISPVLNFVLLQLFALQRHIMDAASKTRPHSDNLSCLALLLNNGTPTFRISMPMPELRPVSTCQLQHLTLLVITDFNIVHNNTTWRPRPQPQPPCPFWSGPTGGYIHKLQSLPRAYT